MKSSNSMNSYEQGPGRATEVLPSEAAALFGLLDRSMLNLRKNMNTFYPEEALAEDGELLSSAIGFAGTEHGRYFPPNWIGDTMLQNTFTDPSRELGGAAIAGERGDVPQQVGATVLQMPQRFEGSLDLHEQPSSNQEYVNGMAA